MTLRIILTAILLTVTSYCSGRGLELDWPEEDLMHSDDSDDIDDDIDDNDEKNEPEFIPAAFMGTVIGNPDYCAAYATSCKVLRCCQYFAREKIACQEEICVQEQCGKDGHHCGIFFGECCYHLGLQCTGNGFRGRCQSVRGGRW